MQRRVILNAIFPGEPFAWQRVKSFGSRRFNSKDMHAAQKRIRRWLKMIKPDLISNSRARFGTQMVFSSAVDSKDGDNCQKFVWDALQGRIWENDRQIDEWQGQVKRCAENPETHLIVYVIE